MDLTHIDPPGSNIDRDEPRLEEEVQKNGVDSVIAVNHLLESSSSSTSTTPPKKTKKRASATPAVDAGVEEKQVSEPVLKKEKNKPFCFKMLIIN